MRICIRVYMYIIRYVHLSFRDIEGFLILSTIVHLGVNLPDHFLPVDEIASPGSYCVSFSQRL